MARTTRICLSLGLLVSVSHPVMAQAKPPASVQAASNGHTSSKHAASVRVQKLISQLGSKEFSEREAAQKALDQMGLSTLDALRDAAAQNGDAEIRQRANNLVRTFETRYEPEIAFAWFDSLGFPDLSKCMLVQVATGDSYRDKGRPPKNSYYRAFLVKDDGTRFTVLTASLATHTYTKTSPKTPEHQQVAYQPLDLEKEMNDLLKDLRRPQDQDGWPRRFGESISEAAEVFVYARACEALRHPKVAKELYHEAKKVAFSRNRGAKQGFSQILSEDLAYNRMWRAVVAFGDLTVSRKELLAQFHWLAKHFPQSSHAARARQTATLLEKMVAEDEAHARRHIKPAKEWSKQERIAELIFRLRDQHGEQWFQPGSCDIFSNDRWNNKGTEKSPAWQLVEIGYDAVPQLIAALDDERFTRSVGFHRNFYFSHYVLRVGDCAVAILERIAGRGFWTPRTTAAAMLKDGQLTTAKAAAQAWWKEFHEKGEKQMLIEGTEAGNDSSPELARRLVEKYPDSALAALRKGIPASDKWTRTGLVELVAKVKGDEAVALLRKELQDTMMPARVAAARGLLDRGDESCIKAMMQEWTKLRVNDALEELIAFLLWCGKPEAIQTLAKGLRKRPLDDGLAVIEGVSGRAWGWERYQKALPPAARQAIDSLLVELLDDTRERTGMSGSWGGKSFSNPRLCDLSGYVLAQRWNEPASFDLSGSLKTRDRQRYALKNLWLKRQGKPPVPRPGGKQIAHLPDGQVLPLLERLESASSQQARREAMQPLLSLGLPGLPAVRAKLGRLNPSRTGYGEIQELAVRMACIVDEVQYSEDSASPPKELRQRTDAWKGKPLTAEMVVDLLRAVAASLPPEVTGVKLAIDREGDDTGVSVSITLTGKTIRREGRTKPFRLRDSQKGWDTFESVAINGEPIANSSGSSSWEQGMSAENWTGFKGHFQKALNSQPERNFSVRVGIVKQE